MKSSDPEKKKKGFEWYQQGKMPTVFSIYSWLVLENMACVRMDEHHTRREEGQQIMLLIYEFWILAIVIWTLHPISYMFVQNAVRRFGLCVYKIDNVSLQGFFPPRCVCVWKTASRFSSSLKHSMFRTFFW